MGYDTGTDYTREQLEQMPLVEFVDMPSITHVTSDREGVIGSKPYPMNTYRQPIKDFINKNPYCKIYIYPQGDSLYFGPITYCPTTFSPTRAFRGNAIPINKFMYNIIMNKHEMDKKGVKTETNTNRKLLLIGL